MECVRLIDITFVAKSQYLKLIIRKTTLELYCQMNDMKFLDIQFDSSSLFNIFNKNHLSKHFVNLNTADSRNHLFF